MAREPASTAPQGGIPGSSWGPHCRCCGSPGPCLQLGQCRAPSPASGCSHFSPVCSNCLPVSTGCPQHRMQHPGSAQYGHVSAQYRTPPSLPRCTGHPQPPACTLPHPPPPLPAEHPPFPVPCWESAVPGPVGSLAALERVSHLHGHGRWQHVLTQRETRLGRRVLATRVCGTVPHISPGSHLGPGAGSGPGYSLL